MPKVSYLSGPTPPPVFTDSLAVIGFYLRWRVLMTQSTLRGAAIINPSVAQSILGGVDITGGPLALFLQCTGAGGIVTQEAA